MAAAYKRWGAGLCALAMGQAGALPFNIGAVEGQLDSQFSLGGAWGTQAPQQRLAGAADGRGNFNRGELFSQRLMGVHALELHYQNTGLYLRGRYWYDFELKDRTSVAEHGSLDSRSAGGQLLDAYLWHNYQWGSQPGTVRVGRQELHWGQALFIGGGIDALNPHDAMAWPEATRRTRDGVLPTSIAYLRQNLSDNWAVEGFYQLAWGADGQANCGSFFASSASLAKGCDSGVVVAPGRVASRGQDQDARDGGQFGLAATYHADALNTDFSAYTLTYHSRAPLLTSSAPLQYQAAYPEGIHLYGLAFSAALPEGTRWRGELSYRPNAPVQENWLQVLQTGAGGYTRQPVSQLQTSLEHTFDGNMGADSFTVAGEVGAIHTGGLGAADYGRDPAFGSPANGGSGFTTANAWGYRAQAQWTFREALPRLQLRPALGFAHDVHGYSPAPGSTFVQGRKAVTVSVDGEYQRTYTARLAYTSFFGGRYSTVADRDYLALTLGVKF